MLPRTPQPVSPSPRAPSSRRWGRSVELVVSLSPPPPSATGARGLVVLVLECRGHQLVRHGRADMHPRVPGAHLV
uniref:Uncharacterized protein n=1 Tax=Oryza sativa subsp. japonica TaxID=39947 RepID=Q650V7_ORYSJ|nr:hypothetical protein [Oryza sativa Japonica Group]BAD46660.1 hypothetical protein [Oryza sativa Japonica Group]